MSASGNGKNKAPRLEDDAYMTPQALAYATTMMLAAHLVTPPRLVLEPSAGKGAFVRAAVGAWKSAEVHALDTRAEVGPAQHKAGAHRTVTGDFFEVKPATLSKYDLVLGNPPYTLAEEFIRHTMIGLLPGASLAFLLRLSFLGSQGRLLGLFRDWPLRYLVPIAGRPSFTPDGRTDASEYGIFVWTKEWHDQPVILDAIEWKGQRGAEHAA